MWITVYHDATFKTKQGMPIGVQLIGRLNDDCRLLEISEWLLKNDQFIRLTKKLPLSLSLSCAYLLVCDAFNCQKVSQKNSYNSEKLHLDFCSADSDHN